ncbi:MAG TPA: potassium/proton antiporter [Bacteroidota bacterium]|nr:potassium/proton antiporter [Bacteroidota bacterium]
MIGIDPLLLIGAVLILLSILLAKVSDNLGVPTLLLFLAVGMLAGSEGPGGIYFDDAGLAQSIGIIALIFILFAGGVDTHWESVRPVLWHSVGLATVGVFLTAVSIGLFCVAVLDFSPVSGLLLGAIISSTDAAAVFNVLRSKSVSLKGNLRPLLELESGSNDPMAVFLTVGMIELSLAPEMSMLKLVALFVTQMSLGGLLGVLGGKSMVWMLNRLRSPYEGIYPVAGLAFAVAIYGSAAVIGGSGFLAVYVAGVIVGNSDIVQKRWLLRFFDGLAWMSQIAMFLTLGLLVFPSQLLAVIGPGLLVSGFLMFVARPLSVLVVFARANFEWREKAFISWVGLRGAVPIILATFPLLANVPNANMIFNLVFFIVLTSVLLQGWSIPLVAKTLRVDAPLEKKRRYPLEFDRMEGIDAELVELIVPFRSGMAGKSIVDLHMPQGSIIVLIGRDDKFIIPQGDTVLQEGDTLLALVHQNDLPRVRKIFSEKRDSQE